MADLPLITSDDFDSLAAQWAELHAAAPDASPFLHPEWHRAWLRHFGGGVAPVFLSVRRDETLIGVAAFDMDREEARSLGDHNVRDYAGPLALPGEEAAVAAGVLEWLREDMTPAAAFWGLPAESPMTSAIEAAGPSAGWAVERRLEAVSPAVNLPDTFDAFVAALPKHDRHELRRKMRHFEAAGESSFTTFEGPLAGTMDDLLHLMRISRGDKDEFLSPTMEAFFRDIAATFSALGMLRLGRLSLDGATVAMTMSFEHAGISYLYNSGYDPAHAHLAVGLVSKAHAIREAIERRQRRFDFLRGDEDYKRRLGGVPTEIVTLRLRA